MQNLMMIGENNILTAMEIIGINAPRIELKQVSSINPYELFINILFYILQI